MTSLSETSMLAGAAGQSTGFIIEQSIRFNDDDSAYLHRTQDTADSKRKLTFSWWMKRGSSLGSEMCVISAGASARFMSRFNTSDQLTFRLTNSTTEKTMTTAMVFRDVSAWYHCVWIADCTGGVSTDFSRLYVNGLQVTMTGTQPSADTDFAGYGDGSVMGISTLAHSLSSQEFDGYLAEMHLIDGYAYGPEYFGEFKTDTDIWIPKEYTGSYGTNGFFVDGRDSSDLGDDESGNGNDFATNGLAAHDQVPDSPTNNWCVMNFNHTHSSITLSNGNLQSTASAFTGSGATILLPSTGKWYAEMRYNNASTGEYPMMGIYNTIKNLSTTGLNPGNTSGDLDIGFGADGRRNEDSTTTGSWGNAVGDGKIGALAIDMDNKKIWFGHNNSGSFVWQASGDPSAGNNEANTKAFADNVVFGNSHYSGSIVCWNFGQEGTFGGTETAQGNTDANELGNFYYSVPTGFLALCSKNLGS